MRNKYDFFYFIKMNIPLFIILSGFFLRVGAIFIIGDTELQNEYEPIVKNMLAGRGFAYYSVDENSSLSTDFLENPKLVIPSAFKSPVYPYFLAAWVKFVGTDKTGMWIIEIFQSLLAALICWLIYDIAREKFDTPQAVLAVAGMSFFPLMVYSATQISDTIIFLTLEISVIYLFIKLDKAFSFRLFISFAILFGIFMLARPEGFIYFPFIFGWLLYRYPQRRFFNSLLFTIVCIMVLLPWGVRNYYQLGKFTMNTSTGLNLWEGQNKNSVGVPSWYVDEPVITISDAMKGKFEKLEYNRFYEIEIDKIYFQHAVEDAVTYPQHSLVLALNKVLFYWTSIYFGFEFSYPGVDSVLYWLPWVLTLPFFGFGIILTLKDYKKYLPLYIVLLGGTFTCMVFFVLPRYTMLVYPWVMIVASHGFWTLFNLLPWRKPINNK